MTNRFSFSFLFFEVKTQTNVFTVKEPFFLINSTVISSDNSLLFGKITTTSIFLYFSLFFVCFVYLNVQMRVYHFNFGPTVVLCDAK